jgi:hypothetical protein
MNVFWQAAIGWVQIVAIQAVKNRLELNSPFYRNRRHHPKWEDALNVRVHRGSDEGQRHLVGDLNPAVELHSRNCRVRASATAFADFICNIFFTFEILN